MYCIQLWEYDFISDSLQYVKTIAYDMSWAKACKLADKWFQESDSDIDWYKVLPQEVTWMCIN